MYGEAGKVMSSFYFQRPITIIMEGIIHIHDYICFFLIWIGALILYMLIYILVKHFYNLNNVHSVSDLVLQLDYFSTKKIRHNALLETYWTLVPAVILAIIAIPSFQLLYSMELISSSMCIVKVTGHQWYWSYEKIKFIESGEDVPKISIEQFDSYMITEDNLVSGNERLLTVDNYLELPFETHIKLLVTSSDVIHSWGVADFGVKIDAVPGRLNQVGFSLKKEGLFHGHCYELCGVNHVSMPIVVSVYDPFILK